MAAHGPFRGVVRDIHDGDTIGVDLDLGFAHAVLTRNLIDGDRDMTCRLYGINAPELGNPDGSGKAARDFLESVLPVGSKVEVTSMSWDRNGGRFDGVVVLNGVNVNELMVSTGHAAVYPAPKK